MSTELQAYSNELLFALRLHDVPGPRIAEALAEVHSHVSETGEDPREAFGPPRTYAEELAAALGVPAGAPFWRNALTGIGASYGLGGAAGAWLLLEGVTTIGSDERGPYGLPAAASLLLGLAVLVALATELGRLARHSDVQVLDPRTGADMTPPVPRWVLPVMVTAPVLGLVLAAVVAVAQR